MHNLSQMTRFGRFAVALVVALLLGANGLLASSCVKRHCTPRNEFKVTAANCCHHSCDMGRSTTSKAESASVAEASTFSPAAAPLLLDGVADVAPIPLHVTFTRGDQDPPPSPLDASLYLRNAQFLI